MRAPSRRGAAFAWIALALLTPAAHAGGEPHRMTLGEAVAHALARHPDLATASSQEAAASARADVAATEGIPRVSLVGQLDRATGNVVPGATFAMPGVPGVAGPPGESRAGLGAWESAAGVSVGWDVLELDRRPTLIDAAHARVTAVRAQTDATRLGIAAATADAFFAVAEARALVAAAEASTRRAQTFHDAAAALVAQKLRGDLDAARAETELATARANLEKARLGVVVASSRLAYTIGEVDWAIEIQDADFAALPTAAAPAATARHPAVRAYDEASTAAAAQAAVTRLGLLPRVELVGAAWLRGSGYVLMGGPNNGTAGGALPDTPNWAIGVVATWTPTDASRIHALARADLADAAVLQAQGAGVAEHLDADVVTARATFDATLAVAAQTAIAVTAARRADALATTRYTTGLGNLVEVADAERALAGAERDDAVARLEAWRARVAVELAQGDLGPLVGGRH